MKRLMMLFGVVALLFVVQQVTGEPAKKECDLARIEDVPKCMKCDRILEKEDVDKERKCTKCGTKAVAIKACVKVGYVCKEHGVESFKPGKCPKCERELSKITVKSEIIYKCPECGGISDSPGDCDICEKPRKKTCRHSGTFPHVPEE